MDLEKIQAAQTTYIGKHLLFFDTIDSTQEEAKRQLQKGTLPHGTVILAEEQTAGQGTKMHSWYTSAGNHIAMTIVLQPSWKIQTMEGFTRAIAESIAKAINTAYGYTVTIKEPNDLLLHHKKICGILTQSITQQDIVKQILIGIGCNVNETAFPKELENIATSFRKEYGIFFCREILIQKILEEMENLIERRKTL